MVTRLEGAGNAGITVGVGGSDTSYRAPEWAMKEAVLRQVGLNILGLHEVAANQRTASPVAMAPTAK